MNEKDQKLTVEEAMAAKARRLDMQHLQAIEGNPVDAEDIAMFEMFEREGWSHEKRRQYIIDQAIQARDTPKTAVE